jgi:single-stranded-DNA-specific exonuclease
VSTELESRHAWILPPAAVPDESVRVLAAELGVGDRLLRVLARRGIATAEELRSLVVPPETLLHDPMLLPDAEPFRARVRQAMGSGERALVFGDFDADGLTGLAILTRALRRLGIDTEPYVPSRLDEGHGLSRGAIARAVAENRSLIITADCGTTSVAEIGEAVVAGIDVLVTDHHTVPAVLPQASAIVNAHRPDSHYPDARLSGAGIAFKLAQLLLADTPEDRAFALGLADLACIGSVADVVPISGENRAILRLGIRAIASGARPGIAALLASAGLDPRRVDVEQIGFAIAPRINAVGRVGEAGAAARLLLTDDAAEAEGLAAELERANVVRRELMAVALAEARAALAADTAENAALPSAAPEQAVTLPVIIVAGPWPVGIVGLVAGRLAEEHGVPAIVFSSSVEPWRGSARGVPGYDLAGMFTACGDLFERFGGHPAAAGCHLSAQNYAAFRERMTALAAGVASSLGEAADAHPARPAAEPKGRGRRPLMLDLVLRAESADYVLLRELAPLDEGADDPPLVGLAGFVVAHSRLTKGDHTQLTLRRKRDVVDAICFGRSDLTESLREGMPIDVVARLSSRRFGGIESLQLDVRDVAPAGTLRQLMAAGTTGSDAGPDHLTSRDPSAPGPVLPAVVGAAQMAGIR